jgi:hypothetical protein
MSTSENDCEPNRGGNQTGLYKVIGLGAYTGLPELRTMTTTVTVRSFTGKAISLQVDPASKVSDVKDRIVQVMGRKSRPALTWKGHELRDHQSLSHYDVTARDVLHICECQRVGPRFALT